MANCVDSLVGSSDQFVTLVTQLISSFCPENVGKLSIHH